MLAIVATVCLMTEMSKCRDVQIPMDESVTKIAVCEKNAQFVLAKWVGDNPGWWITRYRCKDNSKPEQDA